MINGAVSFQFQDKYSDRDGLDRTSGQVFDDDLHQNGIQ